MSFLFPAFLFGLFALAIPIIIHLFSFRRFKKVEFTNVKFLKEVKEETASRARLKHLLVLLSRLLAIAFLVFAFAQPYIKKDGAEVKKGNKAVSVFIDNSFSMNAMGKDMSLFEKAKQKATEITSAYGVGDQFQVLTNEFNGSQQRLLPSEEVASNVEALKISPATNTLSKVLSRQKQALEKSDAKNKILYVISDFQQGFSNSFEGDTNYNIFFVPLATVNQKNVFVDTAWFQNPVQFLNQPQNLLVKIQNTGEAAVERSQLTLRINNEVKAVNEFSLQAGETTVDTLSFVVKETGWHKSELLINDFPITFDDSYFFSFKVAESVNVLAINQNSPNKFLNALFATSDYFKINQKSAGQLDYSKFAAQQLIVLDGVKNIASGLAAELKTYVNNGGNLLIFPPIDIDAASYNNLSRSLQMDGYGELQKENKTVYRINTEEEIFKDVFERLSSNMALPKVKQAYDFKRFSNTSAKLMSFKNGDAFINKYNAGNGKVYMCASPLDEKYSDLPVNAVFVPMVYKMAMSGNNSEKLAYVIGNDNLIEIKREGLVDEMVYKMQGPQQEFIPQQNAIGSRLVLGMNNQIEKAGIFDLSADGFDPIYHFGFNYDRAESILKYNKVDDLKEKYAAQNVSVIEAFNKNLKDVVGTLDQGTTLWKLCIILALLFLAFEVVLLKLWK